MERRGRIQWHASVKRFSGAARSVYSRDTFKVPDWPGWLVAVVVVHRKVTRRILLVQSWNVDKGVGTSILRLTARWTAANGAGHHGLSGAENVPRDRTPARHCAFFGRHVCLTPRWIGFDDPRRFLRSIVKLNGVQLSSFELLEPHCSLSSEMSLGRQSAALLLLVVPYAFGSFVDYIFLSVCLFAGEPIRASCLP